MNPIAAGEALRLAVQAVARQLRSDLGIRSSIGPFDVTIAIGKSGDAIDRRLEKIDAARQSLSDALSAMDELEIQARAQRNEVERLAEEITTRSELSERVQSDYQTVKALKSLDLQVVKNSLGFPTPLQRWVGRALSFGAGILASIIANYLWGLEYSWLSGLVQMGQ